MSSLFVRIARPLAVAALSAAALSGCSIAGTDFHPGVAAEVGDTTVSSDEIDQVATATCAAFSDQLAQANQVVPMRLLKGSVLQAITLGGAVRQFGADHGVQPSAAYTSAVSSTRADAGDLPAEQLDAVVLLRTNNTLITDIAGQVGAQLSTAAAPEAVDGSTPKSASDQAQQIGLTAFSGWLGQHTITVDPQYDVEITADGPKTKDTSVAYAVSELAKAATLAEPDPDATMRLPASQRCGRYRATSAG